RVEPIGLGERVGIEKRKRIEPTRGLSGDVVGTGKPDADGEPDQLDVSERRRSQLQRVVGAAVVDHHDVVRAATLAIERLQTPAEQRTTVPVDDEDGDRHAAELPVAMTTAALMLRSFR